MKKYFTLLALAIVTLVSCDKDETGETPKKEYDIYFACIKVEGETDVKPAYWKKSHNINTTIKSCYLIKGPKQLKQKD